MSNKHFRRMTKENDPILIAEKKAANLQDKNKEKADTSSEEIVTKPLNKFALLNVDDDENNESETQSEVDDENKDNDRKGMKKMDSNNKATRGNSKKLRKHNKKKKAEEIDELKLLAEAIRESNTDAAQTAHNSLRIAKESVLRIDVRLLNPDAELRRLLGRTFGAGMADQQARVVRGNHLVLPRANIRNMGLTMCLYKEVNGVKYFRYKHNHEYREIQQLFWNFQAHNDFENIVNTVMDVNRFHLDALLLMAEHLRMQENFQGAREVLEAGISACERSFLPTFKVYSPDCLLPYEWRENRAFYLFLQRYSLALMQRSCYTTALEFTKIAYIQDDSDPLAILLFIDSLALRAKNFKFLIDFYEAFKEEKNLNMLPNFLYSLALANFLLSESLATNNPVQAVSAAENAEDFLTLALSRFPFILGQILDKLQIRADSAVENNSLFNTLAFYREPEGLRLVSDIYIHHSLELWRQPNVLSWLESTTHSILPRLSATAGDAALRPVVDAWRKRRENCFVGIPRNILRHAIVHEINAPAIVELVKDEERSEVDPVPPRPSFSDYEPDLPINVTENSSNTDSAQIAGNSTLIEFMRTLIPDEIQPQLQQMSESLRQYITGLLDRFNNRPAN